MEKPTELPETVTQDEFGFEPQHDHHDGVAFTFNGTLMIPVAGETERCQKEDAEAKEKRTRIKMNFRDFVKMRP